MENNNATTNADDAEIPQTGAVPNVDSAPGPAESGAPAPAVPLAAAGVEEPSLSSAAGAPPTPSTIPAPAAVLSASSVGSDSKDRAGAEGQVSAVPSEATENNPLQTAGGSVTGSVESDDGGCFEPFIPRVPVPPAHKPAPELKPKSFMHLIDEAISGEDCLPTLSETTTDTEFPAPATDEGTSDAETAKPGKILTAPVQAPLAPPRVATAAELISWIKRVLLAQTILPEDTAELVAFFAISTWFQDILAVFPCLVLTGPACDAVAVLHVLRNVCREAKLLSGFRRSDLKALSWSCKTTLISEPNLDRRTAELLSNLTDSGFMVAEANSLTRYSKSAAIYAGANPETPEIRNCIRIHIAPTNAVPPARPQWLHKMIERLPVHLRQYRDNNLSYVRHWTWAPSGMTFETAAVAAPIGRCIVNAPEFREKLWALLKTQGQQRLSEMSNTNEAVVLEVTLALCRDGRPHAYAREIAAEANRRLEARGETARLRPEHVGHQLKRMGVRSCRISQAGNGPIFDTATVAQLKQLAAMYGVEDTPAETESLLGMQTTETKDVDEVMEVV